MRTCQCCRNSWRIACTSRRFYRKRGGRKNTLTPLICIQYDGGRCPWCLVVIRDVRYYLSRFSRYKSARRGCPALNVRTSAPVRFARRTNSPPTYAVSVLERRRQEVIEKPSSYNIKTRRLFFIYKFLENHEDRRLELCSVNRSRDVNAAVT